MPLAPDRSKTSRRAVLAWACLGFSISLVACKPSSEPRRGRAFEVLGGSPSASLPPLPTAREAPGEGADAAGGALPIVGAVNDAGAPDAGPSEAADSGGATGEAASDDAADGTVVAEVADDPTPAPIGVTPELAKALRKPVSAAAQAKARDLNKSGLAHQRRRELSDASADYQAALAAWPASPFARYNLACVLALTHDTDGAIRELTIVDFLRATDPAAAERLKVARADKDFEALRTDPRFRALTGATEIVVAWVPGADGAPAAKAAAKKLVDQLKDAKWPAKVAAVAWNRMRATLGVEFRADDPIAARAASEIAGVLGIEGADPRREWPEDAPPIVVFTGKGEDPAAPDQPGDPDAPPDPANPDAPKPTPDDPAKALLPFVGRTLSATRDDHTLSLTLRQTGYFTWQSTPTPKRTDPADGTPERRIRTGRWELSGETLILTYKERLEHAAVAGKKPRVETLPGGREELSWSVRRDALVVDGVVFTGREP